MNGLLLVDKPEGVSSAGVIRLLKARLGRTKVGHLGTLDPFASGLLPLCLGEATKMARYLLLEEKAYCGTIQFGSATDTLDRTGEIIERAAVPAYTAESLATIVTRFSGPQTQVPPMYSALKRNGVPLYQLARRGIEVERAARDICIHALRVWPGEGDALDFEVRCSKGTYIRVLASDIAAALGTVGHLTVLRRTAVGAFAVENARSVEALRDESIPLPLLTVREALADLRAFTVTDVVLQALARGQQYALRSLPAALHDGEPALLVDDGGAVGALIEADSAGAWRVVRMLQVA